MYTFKIIATFELACDTNKHERESMEVLFLFVKNFLATSDNSCLSAAALITPIVASAKTPDQLM